MHVDFVANTFLLISSGSKKTQFKWNRVKDVKTWFSSQGVVLLPTRYIPLEIKYIKWTCPFCTNINNFFSSSEAGNPPDNISHEVGSFLLMFCHICTITISGASSQICLCVLSQNVTLRLIGIPLYARFTVAKVNKKGIQAISFGWWQILTGRYYSLVWLFCLMDVPYKKVVVLVVYYEVMNCHD